MLQFVGLLRYSASCSLGSRSLTPPDPPHGSLPQGAGAVTTCPPTFSIIRDCSVSGSVSASS